MRAVHQLLDAPPRILDDPLAVTLLGPTFTQRLRDDAASYQTQQRKALRAHVLLRSRFTEDRLAASIERGIRQYVILGAGFDTFVLRQPPWARSLQIFEIDQAATQTRKRALVAAADLTVATNVHFAAVDLEHESLRDGLERYSIDFGQPTFFSWLGVTMYLKHAAIQTVLQCVASFPVGSEVVLTFAPPPGHAPSPFDQRSADLGEPWISHFEPDEMEARLRAAGFSCIDFLTPEEADVRYFQDRPRDLPLPRRTNIVAAVR